MKTAELAGSALNAWIAKALGEPVDIDYANEWPGFDRVLERGDPRRTYARQGLSVVRHRDRQARQPLS